MEQINGWKKVKPNEEYMIKGFQNKETGEILSLEEQGYKGSSYELVLLPKDYKKRRRVKEKIGEFEDLETMKEKAIDYMKNGK